MDETRKPVPQAEPSAVRTPPFWAMALFITAAAAALWVPGRWAVASVRSLQERRAFTPSLLSGAEGAGPSLSARPPTEIRAASVGPRPVVFRLLAPAAQEVYLGGSFNDFDGSQHPLTRGDDGVWETTLALDPGRYSYKFKVDGRWRLDPTNPERTPEPKESSLIDVY